MSQRQTCKRVHLETLTGSTGHINTLMREWLETETGQTGHINKLWLAYFQANGATSNHFNTAAREYLIAIGCTPAALPTMWKQAWCEGLIGGSSDLLEGIGSFDSSDGWTHGPNVTIGGGTCRLDDVSSGASERLEFDSRKGDDLEDRLLILQFDIVSNDSAGTQDFVIRYRNGNQSGDVAAHPPPEAATNDPSGILSYRSVETYRTAVFLNDWDSEPENGIHPFMYTDSGGDITIAAMTLVAPDIDRSAISVSEGDVFDCTADCAIQFDINSYPDPGQLVRVALRYTDDDNYIAFELNSDGHGFVIKRELGSDTVLDSVVTTVADGKGWNITAQNIRIGHSLARSNGLSIGRKAADESFNQTETGGKVIAIGTGAALSNLRVYDNPWS